MLHKYLCNKICCALSGQKCWEKHKERVKKITILRLQLSSVTAFQSMPLLFSFLLRATPGCTCQLQHQAMHSSSATHGSADGWHRPRDWMGNRSSGWGQGAGTTAKGKKRPGTDALTTFQQNVMASPTVREQKYLWWTAMEKYQINK